MSVEHVDVYLSARRYMYHAPVLRKDPVSGNVLILPLNPLPDGVDLDEYLGIPDLGNLRNDQ